jgi:hypothetical protein
MLEDRQYIRDPEGLLADVVWFDDDTSLPAGATDTGYHHGSQHLWVSDDRTVAHLLDADHVEAWPAPTSVDPVACA